MALDRLHTTKNTAEIRYWFTVGSSAYGMVQHMEFEDIWVKLYDEAKQAGLISMNNYASVS